MRLELKEWAQDVEEPNQGFFSHLSCSRTGANILSVLIIYIVASNDAAPAASKATLSNQVFGTNFSTNDGNYTCIKCGLSKQQDGLAVCSLPVEVF